MFGQRPSFGVSSSFGGFGTNTASTGFGSSASFGQPVFGTPQTTTSSTPFGSGTSTARVEKFDINSSYNKRRELLNAPQTDLSNQPYTFGSGGSLFGSSTAQTSTTGLTGLFGNKTQSSGFNQNQMKPFNFGTPTTSFSGTGTSLFGTNNATSGNNLLSSNIGKSTGTLVKFNAATGLEMMSRGGVSQTIQTKIEVITAMKEYENRSLEELRVEDYLAGRKGPQQQGFAFGSMGQQQNMFMSQPATSSSWLSQPSTGSSLFGSKPQETKPLFGSGQSTGFGTATSGGGLFGATSQPTFAQPTTTTSTGFSFGQSTQNKPTGFSFGQTTSAPLLFGSTTPATQSGSNFGSLGFNFNNQNQGGIFANQNKPTFGSTSTGTNLFMNKPSGTFGGFGTTPSTASPFGPTTNTGGGLFGMNAQKPGFSTGTSTAGFGATTSGFGTGSSIFGSSNPTPFGQSLFGTSTPSTGLGATQPNTGGGLFGSSFGGTGTNLNLGSTFGSSNFTTNPMGANMNLNNIANDNINNLIKALTHNPFGTSLFKTAVAPTGKADELLNAPTGSSANNPPSKTSVSDRTPTYVLPPGSGGVVAKPKPLSLGRGLNISEESKKNLLFSGLDEKNESFSEDVFKVKTFPSVKKLNLKVFKGVKNHSHDKGGATVPGQSATLNSMSIGALSNFGASPSLTNPARSPGLMESPNAASPSPLIGNSPTPDIIKGRSNIKHLQVSNKNSINDTLEDLNVGQKVESTQGGSPFAVDLESGESNKENDRSILDPAPLPEFSDSANAAEFASQSVCVHHPAGIKLSRSGYYTIPSLRDLAEMVDADGSCLVDNFTVGRLGYGNICFLGVTNVAGLDLDAVVYIVRKEVEVYPEGMMKPSPGDELNKPALVTLDCVWPVDKSTHEIITSEERLDAMGWPQYLENQCISMDAKFVEYRHRTGSWVFKVHHFSKYGLQDDENEPPTTQGMRLTGMPQAGQVEATVVKPPVTNALQKDVVTPVLPEGSPKTPLSLSNLPASAPVPFFGSRGLASQGPPAIGLTSPPLHTGIPQPGSPEPAPHAAQRKVFLDDCTFELEKDSYGGSPAAKQVACIHALSPSAERLTLSSRAPPRAIQALKSQLFLGDFEDEDSKERATPARPQEKGQKREFLSQLLDYPLDPEFEEEPFPDAVLAPEAPPKRLFRGKEVEIDGSLFGEAPRASSVARETVLDKSKVPGPPSYLEIQPEESAVGKLSLRDPRTEYQLLASTPDPYFELGREVTSHLDKAVPIKDSLLSKTPRILVDAAVFMGRSFRVGWGPCMTLAHVGHALGRGSDSSPREEEVEEIEDEEGSKRRLCYLFGHQEAVLGNGGTEKTTRGILLKSSHTERRIVHLEKIHLKGRAHQMEMSLADPVLESYLQNVLVCSTVHLRSLPQPSDALSMDLDDDPETTLSNFPDGPIPCPRFVPRLGINLLHRLALTAAQLEHDKDDDSPRVRAVTTSRAAVFDLCAALWGRLDFYTPEADEESQYSMMQARKEALSVWLEEVSENIVGIETDRAMHNDSDEGYLDAVFSHLTARQISKACEVCQAKGDHHLALLISQACLGDETPRQILRDQLSNWAWAGSDAFMSAQRLALYTLVAGKATHDSSHTRINTCLGLDWKRCFAILMWYICPSTSSIAEIMKEYEAAAGISGGSPDSTFCEDPRPDYLSVGSMIEDVRVNNDVCFQLLKLFVDQFHPLEKLLDTSAYTPDPVDVTTSWLLWCILQSLEYTLLSSAKAEALHINMAAYLESVGSWHWAAFVTLCIPDEVKRRRDLSELLNRHLLVEVEPASSDPFYREKELFLVNELKIPEKFIYEAKAIRGKALYLIDEEAWYLIQAGDYNKAHSMIVEVIAPNAVINEDHQHLLKYLKEFSAPEIHEKVTTWESGGRIYLAYLEVIEQVNELRESRLPTASKVEGLRPMLMALCLRLNNLSCTTTVHRLCISEMSRMVVSVLRAILSEDPEGIRVLAQQVTALPLTHECALEELNQITHLYLTTLNSSPTEISPAVS